jgi:hypothetical protein
MLMDVARSYRFNQEVRILEEYLKSRLKSMDSIENLSIWDSSLVYLALSQETSLSDLQKQSLEAVIHRSEEIANQQGWEQVGSFLNLLAAFQWEGDFSVDGHVVVTVDDREPIRVPLKPHGSNKGQLVLEGDDLFFDDGGLKLKLDTSLSDQTVLVTVLGVQEDPGIPSELAGNRFEVSREYVEHTLLAGSHVHSIESTFDEVFRPDDTLLLMIAMDVQTSQPYAEFTFAIPAGTSLSGEAIGHSVTPSSGDGIRISPVISIQPQTDPLIQKLRIEPISPGIHEFILPYQVRWSGTYTFPTHAVTYPKSGESYRIGSEVQLVIQPASD